VVTGADVEQRRIPVALDRSLPLDEAYRLSQNLALANSLPKSLQGKAPDVLAIILYGQEIGLRPMQAIQGIYVVNGRPTLAAQTWLALLRRAGHTARVLEHTDQFCTVHLARGDTSEEHEETFTIGEAQKAGLAAKEVWKQHPKRMLLARAVSNAARFLCPEVALGFYAEGDDFADAPDVEAIVERIHPLADAVDLTVDPEIVDAELTEIEGQLGIEVPS
jgi:hypothetical protein